mgnify:FL=1
MVMAASRAAASRAIAAMGSAVAARVAEATRVAMMSPEAAVTVVVEKASGEAAIDMALEPVHLRTGTCGCVSE